MVTAGPLRFPASAPLRDGPVVVGFRPEAVRLGRDGGVAASGRVRLVENLGGELVVYVDAGGTDLVASFPVSDAAAPAFDSTVPFTVAAADIRLFDPADGRRLDL